MPGAQHVAGDRRTQGGLGGSPAGARSIAGVMTAVLLWAAPAQGREPRGSAAEKASAAVPAGGCRARVLAELRAGEISAGPGCEAERQVAQRKLHRLTRGRGGHGFGLLERATVGLGEVSLLLSEARGCRSWPLRLAGHASLGLYEVKKAGCWVRRYEGSLTVAGVLADGQVVEGLDVLRVREGRATLDLTRLAVRLDRDGRGLDAFVRLELGTHAWAGTVDLAAVRARVADVHAAAVQRGRGVAGLFAVRHPEHAAGDQVRVLALEAMLERQAEDFRAVQRGELAPYRFLERHAWSPYRGQVAALGGDQ